MRRRRERKYLITNTQRDQLHKRIGATLQEDVNGNKNNGYYNHSIYFDNQSLDNYKDKREGLAIRSKPRIRSYRKKINGPPSAFFVEFKNRDHDTVWKERQQLTPSKANMLIERAVRLDQDVNDLVAKFSCRVRAESLSPTATVLYHRRAFSSLLEPSLRITYDSRLMAAHSARSSGAPSGFRFMLRPDLLILEIKYSFGFPNWLLEIIRQMELPIISISKYGLAIESLYQEQFYN